MLIAISNLSETLAAVEWASERTLFTVRPDMVVKLAKAGDKSVARYATFVKSIITRSVFCAHLKLINNELCTFWNLSFIRYVLRIKVSTCYYLDLPVTLNSKIVGNLFDKISV